MSHRRFPTSPSFRTWHAWFGVLAFCAFLGTAERAHAQNACGEVSLASGFVTTGQELAPAIPLTATTTACLQQVAKELGERPFLRSLTIIVRLPDEQRKKGEALAIAKAMSQVLTDTGIPERKVSVVAPAVGHGQKSGVALVYREGRASRAIAKLDRARGAVRAGPDANALAPASAGTTLHAYDFLETGADGHAKVDLADKSTLMVRPSSRLRLGNITLTPDYQRQVTLELLAGSIETSVTKGPPGSTFDLKTRAAVAGVRGTTFRLVTLPDGTTRIETTSGAVDLGNAQGTVTVNGGYGSRVAVGGQPEAPRLLLMPPTGLTPGMGTFSTPPTLQWQPVDGAVSYVVEVARNAQFTREGSWTPVNNVNLALGAATAQGDWFWRVMAVDPDGFVGLPSKIYKITIAPAAPAPVPTP